MRKKRVKQATKQRKKGLPRVPFVSRCIAFFQRLIMKPKVLGMVFILAGVTWFYAAGVYDAMVHQVQKAGRNVANVMELQLENVYLEGQKFTKDEHILQAMNVKIGQPLLTVDLQSIKKRLEALTWVKYAVVERQYPSTLSISIVERKPAALWQYEGRVKLIDGDGKVISVSDLQAFSDLIILVGKDVPDYASGFLSMLHRYPNTEHLVSSAVRVGERRWDIYLFNNIKIKLPEQDTESAWKFISDKHQESDILNSNVESIDLKVPNKMYVKNKA